MITIGEKEENPIIVHLYTTLHHLVGTSFGELFGVTIELVADLWQLLFLVLYFNGVF